MSSHGQLQVYPAGPVSQAALDVMLQAAGFHQLMSHHGEASLVVVDTTEVCKWPKASINVMGTPSISTEAKGASLPAAVVQFLAEMYEGFEFRYSTERGCVQGILGQTPIGQ